MFPSSPSFAPYSSEIACGTIRVLPYRALFETRLPFSDTPGDVWARASITALTLEDALMWMAPPGVMRLDGILPTYDFHEVHSALIRGTPAQIFDAIKTVTPQEILFFRLLMGVRRLPARLLGPGGGGVAPSRPLLAQFLDAGFVVLAETAETELVVGAIAQFWKPWGGDILKVVTAEEFQACQVPGYAKVAVNFFIHATSPGRVTVRTETRVLTTDPLARAQFARYWRLIQPGSAFIRRMWLRAIRRRVER